MISTNRFVAHMSTKLRVYHNDHNDRWYTVCKDPASFRSTPRAVDPATYTYGVSTFPTSYDKGALLCVVMNADTCVVLHRGETKTFATPTVLIVTIGPPTTCLSLILRGQQLRDDIE